MNRETVKRLLPYAGIPALELLFWRLRGEAEPVELLMNGVLLAMGYLAALGDLREKRISNRLVGAMLCAWALILIPQLFFRPREALWLLINGGAGFALAGVLFLTVYLVSRRGLGGGDVKFMAVSGLYLGMDVLPVMLYGSILSAAVGIGLLVMKKIGRRDAIPLAPFLYAGILILLFTQTREVV